MKGEVSFCVYDGCMKRKNSLDSRCASSSNSLIFEWFGEVFDDFDRENLIRSLADHYAHVAAAERLRDGSLNSRRFNDYVDDVSGFLETKFESAAKGKLTPSSEIKPVHPREGVLAPMYEMRFYRYNKRLGGDGADTFRQYECEPIDERGLIAGLKIHRKAVSDDDVKTIDELQDEAIDDAAEYARAAQKNKWTIV